MSKLVEVREFQSITGNEEYENKKDYKYLPEPAFTQLVNFVEEYVGTDNHADAMEFMRVYKSKDRKAGTLVAVNNYVGLIQLKSGYQVQILPKIDFTDDTKKIFLKMLKSLRDFPGKVSSNASLKVSKMNLYEIFISIYLEDVRALVKHGIKSDYICQEDNLKFYKGKLKVNEHIKYNIAHKERFYVSYEEFLPDRPENRLIKSTLLKLQKITVSAQNSKEIRQLLTAFEMIEPSKNYEKDFSKVVIDRNTKDYEMLMKWSKIFLFNKSFTTFSGNTSSRAILFPMEKIYESYIAQQMKKVFSPDGWRASAQDKGYYLFQEPKTDNAKNIFRLRPDIVIRRGNTTVIMDTKWKCLIPDRSKNYGITSDDMYQMYAYAKKYTKGENIPEVWLLYPMTEEMKKTLFFESGDGVKVHAFFINVADVKTSLDELKLLIEEACQHE
jgi:5-methylcytosine-specific restriction enzyme subunit McrC